MRLGNAISLTFLLLFVFLLLLTCGSGERKSLNKTAIKETLNIIKAVIDEETKDVNSISKWTFPAYKHEEDTSKVVVAEFSSIKVFYSIYFLETFVEQGYLTKEDAVFMYSNIDSTLSYELDSCILNLNLISDSKYKEIMNKQGEEGWSKYMFGKDLNKYFVNVSTPLFNKQYTKAFIAVSKYTDGYGSYLILEKENGKWKVLCRYPWWID